MILGTHDCRRSLPTRECERRPSEDSEAINSNDGNWESAPESRSAAVAQGTRWVTWRSLLVMVDAASSERCPNIKLERVVRPLPGSRRSRCRSAVVVDGAQISSSIA